MDKIFAAIDAYFEDVEGRLGKTVTMLLVGALLLIAASFTTAVRFETFFHGNGFTRLSLHPFEMSGENDLRFRILSPLTGYLLFFRGAAFKYFMLLILAIFLGLIYFFQRREKCSPTVALGITAICAFSTLSFHQLYFPAYPDPLSYLLILLFIYNYRIKYLNVILLSLMLFNHENTFFLFPFFFLLMTDGKFTIRVFGKNIFLIFVAMIPYLIYRKVISSYAEVGFTISYYFDEGQMKWTREHVLPHLASGVFQAFRLAWAIPLVAIAIGLKEKNYYEIILILALIIFVLSQFLIAYDISRLTGLCFPVLLLGVRRMREYFGPIKTGRILLMIFLLNFLIPSYYIGALEPIRYIPFWFK